jgi:predicted CXXCH cytochrome family protein
VLDRERRPWLHAPVATAECVFCHDAHGREGSVDHVRRPLRKACLVCHVEADLDPSEHPAGSTRECDECHDPHAAPGAADLFLRERIRPVLGDGPAFRPAEPADAAEEPPP